MACLLTPLTVVFSGARSPAVRPRARCKWYAGRRTVPGIPGVAAGGPHGTVGPHAAAGAHPPVQNGAGVAQCIPAAFAGGLVADGKDLAVVKSQQPECRVFPVRRRGRGARQEQAAAPAQVLLPPAAGLPGRDSAAWEIILCLFILSTSILAMKNGRTCVIFKSSGTKSEKKLRILLPWAQNRVFRAWCTRLRRGVNR